MFQSFQLYYYFNRLLALLVGSQSPCRKIPGATPALKKWAGDEQFKHGNKKTVRVIITPNGSGDYVEKPTCQAITVNKNTLLLEDRITNEPLYA